MFPTQSKAHRFSPLWLLPLIALAMLLAVYLLFASNTAQAQTPVGKYCVEGIVIDWEEKPLAGISVTLEGDLLSAPLETVSEDDDGGSDEGKFSFKGLPGLPGVYTATVVNLPEGWEGVTPTSFSFAINEGEKDCVKIRFKLRYIVPVSVIKMDADHFGLEDWMIKAVPGKGNVYAEVQEEETNADGEAFFNLTPGAWIFVEHPPTTEKGDIRQTYRPVLPPTAQQELTLTRDDTAEDGITVWFKNELVTGCVLVRKIALFEEPNGNGSDGYPAGGWGFKLLRTDGTIARLGFTDARGEVRFDGLPLGPYILVEEDRPGWGEAYTRQLEIIVDGNLCDEPIDFFNYQDDSGFCIEGRKIDTNGGYGIPDWKITVKALDKGFDKDLDTFLGDYFTDGLGKYVVNFPTKDYRIPGAEFEVCEEEQDGWKAQTPLCQTVRLPEWPGACVPMKDFVNQQVGHGKDKSDGTCSAYHVVKPGEGIISIAKKYNVPTAQMLGANPAVKNHPHQWVIIGQKLCIP